MPINYFSFYANKTDLQEMFKFVFTELKTNGFNAKQTVLRDNFALALTGNKQKWSSLLASASEQHQKYRYYRFSETEDNLFNEYSSLALDKAFLMHRRKNPLIASLEDYPKTLKPILNALNIENKVEGHNELDKAISDKLDKMSFTELYQLWDESNLPSGELALHFFCWKLGITEISKEAFRPFVKNEWDVYYNEYEVDAEFACKSANNIINKIIELDYANFHYDTFLTFVDSVKELLDVQTPKMEFVYETEEDLDSLAIYITPFSFSEVLAKEINRDASDFANAHTIVQTKFYKVNLGIVPTNHAKLLLYITEIYNNSVDSISAALFDAVESIDCSLESYSATRSPLAFDTPPVEAFYDQLKKSIHNLWGEHLTAAMSEKIGRLPANPAKQIYEAVHELDANKSSAYCSLEFWQHLNDAPLLTGSEVLNIDILNAEVRIDDSIYKDWGKGDLEALGEITEELIILLEKYFGYSFTLKKVKLEDVRPWFKHYN